MFKRASMSVSSMILATLCLSACGDDDGGGAKAGKPVEDPQVTQQATNLSESSGNFVSISAEASSGQATISQVGNVVQQFANSHQTFKAQAAASRGLTATLAQGQAAEDGNGTYSFVDGRLQANFSAGGSGGLGGSYTVNYSVDLTIAEADGGNTIDGDFELAFATSTGTYDVDYSYKANYDTLTLDSAGCAVGGGFTVNYRFEVGGALFDNLPAETRAQIGNSVGGNGVVAATFGPTCGEMSVTGN